MNKKNIIEVLDLLKETFYISLSYNVFSKEKEITLIRITVDDEDWGWQCADLYFDKNGDIIPDYKEQKQLELKEKIKKLQEEIKELEKESKNY